MKSRWLISFTSHRTITKLKFAEVDAFNRNIKEKREGKENSILCKLRTREKIILKL